MPIYKDLPNPNDLIIEKKRERDRERDIREVKNADGNPEAKSCSHPKNHKYIKNEIL